MQGQYSFLQQDPRFLQQQQAAQGQSPAQLQPQQTGYQQSQHTGYVQPQQTGYMNPQQTGFIQQQRTGFVQPQMTGFAPGGMMRPQQTGMPIQPHQTGFAVQPQQTGFGLQSQPTGFGSGGGMLPASMPPMPPMPSQFQPQQQRFMAGSTSINPMTAQPTGYGMGFRGQMPALGASSQPFLNTFMPAPGIQQTMSFGGGSFQPSQMQFAQQPSQFNGMSLQQTFQQQNQQQIGQTAVKVPWKLSTDEKKSYDQIFRAWDQAGSGFIEGKMSTEVFAQSGLPREDLMQIWGLADVENRGKLNLAEFHVAMGLIYRRLNGNPIPATLPPEMVPPSARDLDNSVDFLKDLLKKDNARSTGESYAQHTLGPVRSLHGARSSPNLHKDATMYKHDEQDNQSTYKSRSRHIDRRTVRHAGEDKTTAGLDIMKRELDRTDSMLESSRNRDDDDDSLDQELEDLKYRIRRIQDDIEHISRSGRRSEAKDNERRKLERDLLRLRHEDLPEIEAKIESRDRERRREAQSYARQRDLQNSRGRFEPDDGRSDSEDYGRRRDSYPDRGYLKGTYDRETPSRASDRGLRENPSRSSYRDTPSRGSAREARGERDDRDMNSESPSTSVAKSPPPAPPSAPAKTMTAEEKKAYIQAEAQRRIQERLRSLGIGGASSAPAAETGVNSRLEQEKQEAAMRASKADEEAAEREKQRQMRLEDERLGRIRAEEELNAKPNVAVQPAKAEPASLPAPSQAANDDLNAEEEAFLRKREEALAKEKAARQARIKQLEEEEAESRRLEEEFHQKKAMFASRASASPPVSKKAPPPAPASRTRAPPPPAPGSRSGTQISLPPSMPQSVTAPTVVVEPAAPPASVSLSASPVPPPPPPPPAPPAPPTLEALPTPGLASSSTNPFHRLTPSASTDPAGPNTPTSFPTGLSANNPFFKPTDPAPVSQPAVSTQRAFRPPPRPQESDDEWDAVKEKDDDDDSDEEGAATARKARQGLAEALFGGTMPSRPQSAADNMPSGAAPRAPVIKPSGGPADRGMLLGEIQGGARLRKTKTNDRSSSALAGRVIGSSSPPRQSPQEEDDRRQSVDWIGGMAADGMQTSGAQSSSHQPTLQAHAEEPVPKSEESQMRLEDGLDMKGAVGQNDHPVEDISGKFDLNQSIRLRAIYGYEGQRAEDLKMVENQVIIGHPSKMAGEEEWMYGTVEESGMKGTFPRSYVEEIHVTWGVALYSYTASSGEEVSLRENEKVAVVDCSDPDWFKVEEAGRVGLAPGAYIELSG